MSNNPRPPRVIIIGAGIAGLCTGVYARKSGFDVEIIEMSDSSGGLATSWKRGDYTFETCLQWLLGSRPGSAFNALWKEVCDIDALTFVDRGEVLRIEAEDGRSVGLSRDVDRMEHELVQYAPEDGTAIKRLAAGVRRLARFDVPFAHDTTFDLVRQMIAAIPYLPELRAWSRLTSAQFGER